MQARTPHLAKRGASVNSIQHRYWIPISSKPTGLLLTHTWLATSAFLLCSPCEFRGADRSNESWLHTAAGLGTAVQRNLPWSRCQHWRLVALYGQYTPTLYTYQWTDDVAVIMST
jgi:hypothetical protein